MPKLRRIAWLPLLFLAGAAIPSAPPRFAISFPAARSTTPLDGRLLLIISADTAGEPRFGVSDAASTAQIFGTNVDGWRAGSPTIIDGDAFGYPLPAMADIKPGRYRVQAFLNRYETFRRSDGKVVKLPPDMGEGQQWARKPGNLYSTPQWITIDGAARTVTITLDQIIPPIADPPESKYV